jgi:hypothetical protein
VREVCDNTRRQPIADRDSHRYGTGAMVDVDFYEKALFVERPVARFNYSGPSLKMCRLADAPAALGAYAAVVA